MDHTPIVRAKNFNLENLKLYLELYQEDYNENNRSFVDDELEKKLPGYTQTYYQGMAQFGIEYKEEKNGVFLYHSYLKKLDDESLEEYIKFWFMTYYTPNYRTKGEEKPILLYVEMLKELLLKEGHSLQLDKFNSIFLNHKSKDILRNLIIGYGKYISYDENEKKVSLVYEDINDINDTIKFIENNFPIPKAYKSGIIFYNRYSEENFLKFKSFKNKESVNLYLEFRDWLATVYKKKGTEEILSKNTQNNYISALRNEVSRILSSKFNKIINIYQIDKKEKIASFIELFSTEFKERDEEMKRALSNALKRYYEFLEYFLSNKKEIKNISLQKIVYGAPGTGKSYSLNEEVKVIFETNKERVTFYDGYTYGQFVGMYKPSITENENISYKYIAGPFMKQLVKAYKDSSNKFCLIIEEINRAKADKVFGNIFQLLDRDEEGNSRYPISVSEEQVQYLREELKDKKDILKRIENEGLYLPNNFYIWATMNSADDGVQPLDTAFKRRWNFNYISLNANEENFGNENEFIIGTYKGEFVFWNKFRKILNIKLKDRISEDRLIAPFFISPNDFDENNELGKKVLDQDIFIEKVLMYIFDDLLRHYPKKREQIFKNEIVTFSDIVDKNKVKSEEGIKEEENFLEKIFLEDFIKDTFIKEEKLGVQNEGENSSN